MYGKPVGWVNVAAGGRGTGAEEHLAIVLGYVGAVAVDSTALQMAIWYELPSHISVELSRQIVELHLHGWAPLFANTRSVKVALMAAATITSKPRETIESKLIFCCFVMLRATEKCQYNLLRIT